MCTFIIMVVITESLCPSLLLAKPAEETSISRCHESSATLQEVLICGLHIFQEMSLKESKDPCAAPWVVTN